MSHRPDLDAAWFRRSVQEVIVAVERARSERAKDRTSRGRYDVEPDSGALSETEERERADRPL